MMPKESWKRLLTLLLLALAVRGGAAVWWQQRLTDDLQFGFPDSESYWHLAARIGRGEPYQMNPDRQVFRMPGYPLLLAPLFVWWEDPPVLAARAWGAVWGTLAVAGVWVLAGQLFDRRAAWLAGAAALLYPGGIAMSVFVLSEALFAPLMVWQLVLWVLAWKTAAPGRQFVMALAAGLIGGAATLARASWLLFTPLVSASMFLGPGERSRALRLSAGLLLGLTVTMLPWWVRNWRVTGRFVPTTLQVGESLYDGLGPQAQGGSDMRFVDAFRRRLRAEEARIPTDQLEGTFEARLDRRMRDAALAWAAENPGQALRLAGVKLWRIWSVWPNEPSLAHWRFGLVVLIGYTPLLLLGLWGSWRFALRGWPYVLCLLPALYFSALHMVFVGSIRYRQPPMLALIVLAAGVVGGGFGRSASRTARSPAVDRSADSASGGDF